MKIVCEKENILKAINSVTKAVASKTTMPILEGILIQTNDNDIKFTTYDLEMGIEYIINEAQIIEQGATVVNSIMFSEIIRKLPDSDIKITLNENNLLVIECEGSLYKLATMNPDEFPELPKISVENSIEIEQTILKDMIRKTIFAVSTEENRPIFTGCLFEIANNKLNVVAVDGFRLAWKSKFLQNKVNNFSAVIPGRTLNEINKILIDSFDNNIRIYC
jgi:DNA polymerase-3 subunit beta